MNFEDFFTHYELESIKDSFIENEFSTILALTEVSDEDLKEMGIKALGKRRQFLAAIKDYQGKSNEDLPALERPGSKRKLDMGGAHLEDKEYTTPLKRSSSTTLGRSSTEYATPLKRSSSSAENSKSSMSNWLSSPFNEEKVLQAKKIHLFSSLDIQRAYGLRRKKMEFINSKLKQLIKDPDVRAKSKTTIMGIAEVAWDKYNAEEAKIDEIEVKSPISSLQNRGIEYNEKQLKTITKDSERTNRALSDIKTQLKRIKETKNDKEMCISEKNKKVVEQENQLTMMHHELQKATDALRKACGIRMIELQRILKKTNNYEDSLSDVSDDSIVDDVKANIAEENDPEKTGEEKGKGQHEHTGEDIEKNEHEHTGEDIEKNEHEHTGEDIEKNEHEQTGEDIEKNKHEHTGEDIEKNEHEQTGEDIERNEHEQTAEDIEKNEHEQTGEDIEKNEHEHTGEDIEKNEHEHTGEDIEKNEHEQTAEDIEKNEHEQTGEDIEKNEHEQTGEDMKKNEHEQTGEDIEKNEH